MDDIEAEQLMRTAKTRMDGGDPASAREMLERAAGARPADINILMLLTVACRMQRDNRAALNTIAAALKLDPYSFLAHLSRGAALEDLGERVAAADAYRSALALAPPKSKLQPPLQASLAHATQAVKLESERLQRYLLEAVAAERTHYPERELRRFDECLNIFSGCARPFVHECSLLHFPQLAAIPFYDESLFPWLSRLEQATGVIREELTAVIAEESKKFHPYIQYPEGSPLRQWKELNHSPSWTAFDLWRDGKKFEANCARCPNTAALLAALPMAEQQDCAPTAMFSVLAPHTRIPPHTGSTNVRLIVHLPLILPPGCRFRVGNEIRDWQLGRAWVFDDTIEHEAWNDSDDTRVILIFDVWNPMVTEIERALVSSMMNARRQFL